MSLPCVVYMCKTQKKYIPEGSQPRVFIMKKTKALILLLCWFQKFVVPGGQVTKDLYQTTFDDSDGNAWIRGII